MATPPATRFLPDFGSLEVARRFTLLCLLIALIVVVGRNSLPDQKALQDIGTLGLFAFIVSVLGIIVLRAAGPALRRLSPLPSSAATLLLLLAVIAASVELMLFGFFHAGMIPERWPSWHLSVLARSLLVGGVVGALALHYLSLMTRVDADAKSGHEARLQALQSRIRPHFLFNSLNSVASLTRSDPARAEAAIQDLADLFRVLMADARKLVPISAERELARQYLEIEKLRLGDRLKIEWSVRSVPKSALIPSLTLQPLLENAIYHGIEPRFSGGTLRVELWGEQETLNILISNPLPEVRKQNHSRGNRLAQDNIRQRLASHFGDEANMHTFEDGNHYHARVRMPIVRG